MKSWGEGKMANKIFKMITILFFLVLIGCDQNPFDKLYDPTGDGALGGGWGPWVIYDDQLNTRGGVMLSPSDEHQTFSEVTGNPHSGRRCIKYSWDGTTLWSEKDGKLVNWTAAFLIVAPTWQEYEKGEKDLSPGNYKKITFWIRGNLSSGAKIRFEGPGPYLACPSTGNFAPLPNTWTMKTIDLSGFDLSQVKEFFKIVFIGGGGTVYVDDITYKRE
jgi:hypothetical protein